MQPFFTPERDGHGRIHVYLQPDLSRHRQLSALIAQARDALGAFSREVMLVADEWLHLTVAQIIEVADLAHLRASLKRALQDQTAFTLRMGSVVATRSAVVLDVDDLDDGFAALGGIIAAAVADSTGRAPAVTTEPHMTLAYGADTATVDSGRIGTVLRRQCRPPHAPLTITEVQLVRVTEDRVRGMYTWDCLERYRLTPRTGDAHA